MDTKEAQERSEALWQKIKNIPTSSEGEVKDIYSQLLEKVGNPEEAHFRTIAVLMSELQEGKSRWGYAVWQ